MSTTRIPIYVNETDVAPGLPTLRTYDCKGPGKCIGSIIIPDEVAAIQARGQIHFHLPGKRYWRTPVVSAVQAAISGIEGLAWEAES